jgi:hypothetical protein
MATKYSLDEGLDYRLFVEFLVCTICPIIVCPVSLGISCIKLEKSLIINMTKVCVHFELLMDSRLRINSVKNAREVLPPGQQRQLICEKLGSQCEVWKI